MQRRDFLTAAGATAVLSAATPIMAQELSMREFIELRTYTVKGRAKRDILVETLEKAFIPAVNALGIKPVGVLLPLESETKFADNVFVVIPHKSFDSFQNLTPNLLKDETFLKSAFFKTNSKDPVYTNCESALLRCFEKCPKLELPNLGVDRFYQIRTYRSFSIERNAAKIDMFNNGGEMALFRELGLNPIFFGEALTGKSLPNLTYMVGCESQEVHDKTWKDFIAHPKWQTIKGNPAYADTATEITRVLLQPSAGSQI